MSGLADLVNGAEGAARAADSLLRAAGGRAALLRMPAAASAGDVTEQLGLATPLFQDVELAPVVFRKARAAGISGISGAVVARWELVVSATAVQKVVGSLGFSAASVLFETAFGVVVDGVLMEVASATASEVFGVAYVYRLVLHAPVALIV